MSLLLLPLEILRDILELAIVKPKVYRVNQAVKIRLVNSECLNAIFTHSTASHIVRVI